MAINKSRLLTARGNGRIFIHNQSQAKKQSNRHKNEIGIATNFVMLSNCQGRELRKSLM